MLSSKADDVVNLLPLPPPSPLSFALATATATFVRTIAGGVAECFHWQRSCQR
jgi:hypothetical protein